MATPDDSIRGKVDLMWSPNVPAPTGYNVYWANYPEGPYTKVNATPYTGTSASVVDIPTGPRYYWVVTAVVNPESGQSNPVEGTTRRTIVVDPGHGGGDPGATGRSSPYWGGGDPPDSGQGSSPVEERLLNRLLALDIKTWAEFMPNSNVTVLSTRNLYENEYKDLNARPLYAHDNNGDIFLSVHFNGTTGTPLNQMGMCVHSTTPLPENKPLPYPGAPRMDQFNLPQDREFGTDLLSVASFYYQQHARPSTPPSAPFSTRLDQDNRFRVTRDSLLNGYTNDTGFPPENFEPKLPAALIEVNFLQNQDFHYSWNDGPQYDVVRSDTAAAIARELIYRLDYPYKGSAKH